MNLPRVTIEQLLEAGVHFGHNIRRWNPKMEQYIFGVRNKIHIIDLRITLPLIDVALSKLHEIVSKSGKVLIDELRMTGVKKEKGTAFRLSGSINFADFLTISSSYTKKERASGNQIIINDLLTKEHHLIKGNITAREKRSC